ncbi:MAG TPA: hypothetical protein VGN72_11520 [Tepidisphaeraceae bacterium]|jgi:hypothetical protein|nr:hypothetical protein [Tepidisphaeraceae bacterium]
MAVREFLDKNRNATVIGASLLIVLGLGASLYQLRGGSTTSDAFEGNMFFSVDDGKTWFPADAKNVPPFDHEGKPAVLAHVFDCGGTEFVGYLERYTPQAREVVVASRNFDATTADGSSPPAFAAALPRAQTEGRQLKRPGEKDWTSGSNLPAINQIMQVKCPEGSSGSPQAVVSR